MPTNESDGLSTARGLVHALAAELRAEQQALPLGIFGTPIPRHYEINTICQVLAALDNQMSGLVAPRCGPQVRRARPFVKVQRARCCRCGNAAAFEWSTCAIGRRYLALCSGCDTLLNRLALGFVIGPDAARTFVDQYERAMRERAANQADGKFQDQGRRGVASLPARRKRTEARSRRREKQAEQVAE